MVDLIKLDKTKHEYVVGIDFGHGETSAAICEAEWDKPAGQRENDVNDIDLEGTPNEKVIPSAICFVGENPKIGDDAFEYMTTNDCIRIGFKQKPESLEGEQEQLMVAFMREVYNKICEKQEIKLCDGNHIVYIARPSGWKDESVKKLYCQMALAAGIPLAGLTSESRAAIFYAKAKNKFVKEISKGAIVFDLGSSTLDFTYLADDSDPIDHGYELGASIVDEVIFDKKILPQVEDFLADYPKYKDALLFRARKFKEEAYRRKDSTNKLTRSFDLNELSADEASMGEYGDLSIKLKISNLDELNELIQSVAQYQTRLGEAMDDFKNNHIHNKKVYGVFLTGGASRMSFIKELVAEHFDVPIENVKYDDGDPSLTISRGIALLGTMDTTTEVLVLKLKSELSKMIYNNSLLKNLIDMLSSDIPLAAWEEIEKTAKQWVTNGQTTSKEELKNCLQEALKNFQTSKVRNIANNCLRKFVRESDKDIRKRMNEIIRNYAPGREIVYSQEVSMSDVSAISSNIADIIVEVTEKEEKSNWSDVFYIVLGILIAPIALIVALRETDKDARQYIADRYLEHKEEIISKISEKIRENIDKSNCTRSVQSILEKYFNEQFEHNLNKVKIPIE